MDDRPSDWSSVEAGSDVRNAEAELIFTSN